MRYDGLADLYCVVEYKSSLKVESAIFQCKLSHILVQWYYLTQYRQAPLRTCVPTIVTPSSGMSDGVATV